MVLVAGAASNGIADGSIVSVRVRLLRPGTLPKISDRAHGDERVRPAPSVATRTNVIGLDPKCAGAQPALFEVLPATVSADPGEPIDLRINGCGFSADKNVVKFGDVTVRNIKIDRRRHADSRRDPEDRREPAARFRRCHSAPATYDVTVNNGRGTSNAKRVTLR